MVTMSKSQWETWKITCFWEKSMGNCENDMFYEKVHPQGESQWETGKMGYFPQKSTHRGKVNGNDMFYEKVHLHVM
jgi:hypothetical protein